MGPSPPARPWALVISSEHASRDRPPELADPSLADAVFETHVAWDPGAREIARALAAATGAPLHLGRYTRLFVDLNRSPTSPEAVPATAFGVHVPPNARLDADQIRARIAAHHAPYWAAVERDVLLAHDRAQAVLHLSVHSFVEEYQGRHRALDLGLLFDPARALERRVADHLARAFRRAGFDARDNEPYDGRADALTTALRTTHGGAWYAGVELEINQRHLGRLEAVEATVVTAVCELLDPE